MNEPISAVVMLVGSLFTMVAALGLHRFDDVFSRIHAAGKAATLGLGLVSVGAAIRFAEPGPIAMLALVVVLAVVTLPAGVALIARAAWRSGTELAAHATVDEACRPPSE